MSPHIDVRKGPRWGTATRHVHISLYIDRDDWWIGYYRGPNHHYVCLLPTVVIRWNRLRGEGNA